MPSSDGLIEVQMVKSDASWSAEKIQRSDDQRKRSGQERRLPIETFGALPFSACIMQIHDSFALVIRFSKHNSVKNSTAVYRKAGAKALK